MAAPTIVTPWKLSLIEVYLRGQGFRPLFVGDDAVLRFQSLDESGAGEDLTGATVELTLQKNGVTLIRKTGVDIPGGSRSEITLDLNQSTEVGETGKGWFSVNFASTAGEVAALTPFVGLCDYALVRRLADGDEKLLAMGQIEILEGVGIRPIG